MTDLMLSALNVLSFSTDNNHQKWASWVHFLVKETDSEILSTLLGDRQEAWAFGIEPKSVKVPSLDQALSINLEQEQPSHDPLRVIRRVILSYFTTNLGIIGGKYIVHHN